MDGLNALRNPHLKKFFSDNFKTGTPVDAVAASVTLGTSTSVCTLTHDVKGAHGNDFSVSIVSSTDTTATLAIAYDKWAKTITITPARAAGSDTTTGAQLATAINADATLDGIITASSGGAGVMAEEEADFASGVDGTPGIGYFTRYVDSNYTYFCVADATVNSTGAWEKVPHFGDNFVVGTPVNGVAAAITLGTSTSVCTVTFDTAGVVGNDYSIAVVSSAEDEATLALTFTAATKALVITPARTGGSDTTTGAELQAAINADETLSALMTASAGGVGVMAEAVAASLTGGVDGTVGIGGITRYIDTTNVYYCTGDASISSTDKWRKIAHSAL